MPKGSKKCVVGKLARANITFLCGECHAEIQQGKRFFAVQKETGPYYGRFYIFEKNICEACGVKLGMDPRKKANQKVFTSP